MAEPAGQRVGLGRSRYSGRVPIGVSRPQRPAFERLNGKVILSSMTHKVGAKGQVVIPKPIRDRLGIQPGDEVVFEPDGTDVRIRRLADEEPRRAAAIRSLRGIWADRPGGGTAALEAERRVERELEERRARSRGVGRPR